MNFRLDSPALSVAWLFAKLAFAILAGWESLDIIVVAYQRF